jgi:hypothetical protein
MGILAHAKSRWEIGEVVLIAARSPTMTAHGLAVSKPTGNDVSPGSIPALAEANVEQQMRYIYGCRIRRLFTGQTCESKRSLHQRFLRRIE